MKLKSILLLSASALIANTRSHAQLHVSTGTSKYVLLEEATGAWCGYCPDGAQIIEEDIKADTSLKRVNIISWHGPTGYGEPMMISGGPYDQNSNYDSLGYPSAVIDRAPYSGKYSTNRGSWKSAVAARYPSTANFQVDLKSTYDTTSRLLTVTITGKALAAQTGKWNVNVFVTEDSISSAATGYVQHSYMFTNSSSWYYNQCTTTCGTSCSSCANLPDSIYKHMSVARAILATSSTALGFWGDSAFNNPAAGATYSKTYTYSVPSTYNARYMKVIGLVQKYGTNQYERPIENSITAKLRLMPKNALSVPNSKTMTEIELFPNPAQNSITVTGLLESPTTTNIVVYNMMGQVMHQSQHAANGTEFSETINLSHFANGVYVMHINNNGETVSKRFNVIR